MTARTFTGVLFITLLALARLAQAAEENAAGIAGTWEGKLAVGPASLRLVFNLAVEASGRPAGTLDSPDQGAYGIALDRVTFAEGVLLCEAQRIGGVFEGKLDPAKREIDGQWRQLGRSFPLTLRPGTPIKPRRPQEPKPPYPYVEEEVTYRNDKAGVTFAGTLTKPQGPGSFPAVLLITGSGPQNRNEELMGHKPFLVLADDLTKRGLAVLRVDDRGVGGSTGSRDTATGEDFAGDVLAGVAYLKSRSDVEAKRIGLVGHSEGATIAAMVAASSKDIAFIAMLAGPGVKGSELLLMQAKLISQISGVSAGVQDFNDNTQRQMFAIVQGEPSAQTAQTKLAALWEQRKQEAVASTTLSDADKRLIAGSDAAMPAQIRMMASPWMRHFLSYDPAATLRRVRVPVLAVNGLIDLQVPARQNLPAIETALKAGGNTAVKIVELRDLNHLLQKARTGSPAEYGAIEETINPQALATIGDWVVEQARADRARR
jgi:uncharacterized protein